MNKEEFDLFWDSKDPKDRLMAVNNLSFIPSEEQVLRSMKDKSSHVRGYILSRRDYACTEKILDFCLNHKKSWVRRTFAMPQRGKKTQKQFDMGLLDEDASVRAYMLENLDNKMSDEQILKIFADEREEPRHALAKRYDWTPTEDMFTEVFKGLAWDVRLAYMRRKDWVPTAAQIKHIFVFEFERLNSKITYGNADFVVAVFVAIAENEHAILSRSQYNAFLQYRDKFPMVDAAYRKYDARIESNKLKTLMHVDKATEKNSIAL